MIRMFVRHSVKDFGTWKRAYDAFGDERSGMGVIDHAVFRGAESPNEVTVWHDFETIESARAFAGSDRLRSVMGEAGVASEPIIWFTSRA